MTEWAKIDIRKGNCEIGQDSNGAHQSDMIHNPTLSGLCLIRHKPESLPPSTLLWTLSLTSLDRLIAPLPVRFFASVLLRSLRVSGFAKPAGTDAWDGVVMLTVLGYQLVGIFWGKKLRRVRQLISPRSVEIHEWL
jgi:hypothetical protein